MTWLWRTDFPCVSILKFQLLISLSTWPVKFQWMLLFFLHILSWFSHVIIIMQTLSCVRATKCREWSNGSQRRSLESFIKRVNPLCVLDQLQSYYELRQNFRQFSKSALRITCLLWLLSFHLNIRLCPLGAVNQCYKHYIMAAGASESQQPWYWICFPFFRINSNEIVKKSRHW